MQCSWRPAEGTRSATTGATNGDDLPCGYWDQQLGTLQEQYAVLTARLCTSPQTNALGSDIPIYYHQRVCGKMYVCMDNRCPG